MKECNKCKNILSLNEFHNNKRMKDGKQRSCKACVKIKDAKHWVESGKYRPRDREREKAIVNEIASFKRSKIKKMYSKIDHLESEIRKHEDIYLDDRGFNYSGLNNIINSSCLDEGLSRAIGNYLNDKSWNPKELNDLAESIQEHEEWYSCTCCDYEMAVKDFYIGYNKSLKRGHRYDVISNLFVYVSKVCQFCYSHLDSEFNKKLRGLKSSIESIKEMIKDEKKAENKFIIQRIEWSKSRKKHESKFLANIDQCENGRYLYIMKWRDLYKVGISNNPLKRRNFIKNSLHGSDKVDLLYVCKPYKGRSIDNETLIHKSLKEYRADVTWKDGKKSREFFKCDLSLIKLAVSEQCYIEDAKELMA
jgi:hypothetical protein